MKPFILFSLFLLTSFWCSSVSQAQDTHVVISEIVVTPTSGEFIEIFNPTVSAVDLTDYYLSDNNTYFRIPGNNSASDPNNAGPAPSIPSSDFIVKFPAGTMIPAGGVLTIALDGTGFNTTYGFDANFEIAASSGTTTDMLDGNTVAGGPGRIGGSAGLTNSGEMVILFSWNGTSDLVQDIDYLLYGTSTNAMDKTLIAVDGPDAGTTTTAYLLEIAAPSQSIAPSPGSGSSTKRELRESASTETFTGGNGISGHDETSENLNVTFAASSPPTPGSVPTALPVELTDFGLSLVGGNVEINWATASETNNSHFELEHSINGTTWVVVGEVNGVGNSDTYVSYFFLHDKPTLGRNFYRLKQVDIDGTAAYSQILETVVGNLGQVTLYPNPVKSQLTLSHSKPMQQGQVTIFDTSGKVVYSNDYLSGEAISVEWLIPGYYILKFENPKESMTIPFVKE